MISKGRVSSEVITSPQADIAAYYFNIKTIPCLIHSPLRKDNKASFAFYSPNKRDVYYIDYSTNEKGSLWTLLSKLWNCDINSTMQKVAKEVKSREFTTIKTSTYKPIVTQHSNIDIQCKIRKWEDYDLNYWKSYGISLKWLKYANVYPISHKIVIKDNISYLYKADKYAYAFVEFKEGKTSIKVYQPFNRGGYKWANTHDKSVLSLWTKLPKKGDKLCICSSLKDALCLWANTGIPAIALQGEGYNMSITAQNVLKSRFKNIYIMLDNDAPGLKDAKNLAEKTGFINIILPQFDGGKDISDFFKIKGKQEFTKTINSLFTS
jgi:hypothetical protein